VQENQSGIPSILRPILGSKGNNAISRGTFELQQQINQRPDDYMPKVRLAQLYIYSGNAADAKDLLEDAMHAAPNNVEVRRTNAICLKQLGEESRAISEFAQSVKLEEQQHDRTGAAQPQP
jgi:Tfp pilus assembly protein PilF